MIQKSVKKKFPSISQVLTWLIPVLFPFNVKLEAFYYAGYMLEKKTILPNPHHRSRTKTDSDANLLGFFALLYKVNQRNKREKRTMHDDQKGEQQYASMDGHVEVVDKK
jgi:hypothetical protein